jgi:hypothetical protein
VGIKCLHLNISEKLDYANHLPLVPLLCPPPINVILTANTFVRFLHNNQVNVGLVLSVNPMEQLLCIQLFLSWVDVVHQVGALIYLRMSDFGLITAAILFTKSVILIFF